MTARGTGCRLKSNNSTFQDIGDQYVEDLLQIDDREGDDEEKVDDPEDQEEDKQVGAKRKTRGGGVAAEGHVKSKAITYNRPPFVKCLESLQNFTFSELDELFSAALQEVYEARRMSPTRMVEDDLQFETDLLPFGVRHHRRAGKRDLL